MKAWKEEKEKDEFASRKYLNNKKWKAKWEWKKKVIKVLKTNGNIFRDAAEKKKNVMIYGLKEKVIPMRIKREKKLT